MDEAKQQAGHRAADLVSDGMIVGLGTGSTVFYAMERLAMRIRDEDLCIIGIPTSYQAAYRAVKMGIPLSTLDEHPTIDLAIDGADQIDPMKRMIKGRGAAHFREKCVADAAEKLLIVCDATKCVSLLHGIVPIEVLPFACMPVIQRLFERDGSATLRTGTGKDGPVISDNGMLILDCMFGDIISPDELELQLSGIPGIIESGLFTRFTGKTSVFIGKESW